MHIKATGQITLSAAFFQWLTPAVSERAENRNAKACWLKIPLTSCDRVGCWHGDITVDSIASNFHRLCDEIGGSQHSFI